MRISVFLLPNSMLLIVHLSLVVASALLLFLCSTTSCLAGQYQDCDFHTFPCGKFNFSYPFERNGSGCGDPKFHLLDCDDHSGHPILNISGEKYRILELFIPGSSMTIVNENLFGSKCNLSGKYSQLWSPGFPFRISGETYTNLTLSRQCDTSNEEMSQLRSLPLCGDVWYYNITKPEDGADFCQIHLQVPINKNYLSPERERIVNQTILQQGFEVTWWVDQYRNQCCDSCLETGGRCGHNISAQFLCYSPDGTTYPARCPHNPHGPLYDTDDGRTDNRKPALLPPNPHGPPNDPDDGHEEGQKNRSAIVIGCSVGGAALTALALILFLMYYARVRKPSPSEFLAIDSIKSERKDMEGFVPGLTIDNLSIFSYEELRQATNRFHEENEIGDGGFGSVYLGKLRDGRIVAVKRLYQGRSTTVAQFINEVAIFSSMNHPHLVRLYGCTSTNSPELLLVYEFVPNGTLENHLHGDRQVPGGLSWNTRLNIALQTAQALAFLHSLNPPIFHRDVKSSNILLDENFNVKVADFGLCRHVPVNASHVTTTPQGTPGYVDPEYHKYYQLTEKSDVYSFGVVLVEIISAKLAVDVNRDTREINLANMAISKIQEGALHELVDLQLEIETNHEVKVAVSAVAELAFRCLASESDDRPRMNEVVAQLEVIKCLWDVCPSPHEESLSFPTHKHWRSLSTSVKEKWPIMGYHAHASA